MRNYVWIIFLVCRCQEIRCVVNGDDEWKELDEKKKIGKKGWNNILWKFVDLEVTLSDDLGFITKREKL